MLPKSPSGQSSEHLDFSRHPSWTKELRGESMTSWRVCSTLASSWNPWTMASNSFWGYGKQFLMQSTGEWSFFPHVSPWNMATFWVHPIIPSFPLSDPGHAWIWVDPPSISGSAFKMWTNWCWMRWGGADAWNIPVKCMTRVSRNLEKVLNQLKFETHFKPTLVAS